MAYTFTERKRIRKSFGTRASVLKIPYLLQMQKDAYTAFLQADTPPKKRTHEGLQAAFESAFPIISTKPLCEMMGKADSNAACRPSCVRFFGGVSACKKAV